MQAGNTLGAATPGSLKGPYGHMAEAVWNPQMRAIRRELNPHRTQNVPDYRSIEQGLADLLKLPRRPVAVAFRETAPAGVAKFSGTEPSGCSFWRIAAEGRSFTPSPATITAARSAAIPIILTCRRSVPRNLTRCCLSWPGPAISGWRKLPAFRASPQPPRVVIYAPPGGHPGGSGCRAVLRAARGA